MLWVCTRRCTLGCTPCVYFELYSDVYSGVNSLQVHCVKLCSVSVGVLLGVLWVYSLQVFVEVGGDDGVLQQVHHVTVVRRGQVREDVVTLQRELVRISAG